MKSIYFQVPAAACFLISVIALLGSIRGSSRWQPIFYAFLPACFLYMGSLMVRMHHEIARLRRRVTRLEQRLDPAAAGRTAHPASGTDRHDDETVVN